MVRSLIINGSPRPDGMTMRILRSAAEMLMQRDIQPAIIDLRDLNVSHCRGCMECRETGKCAIDDDMTRIYEMIRDSDMLIWGSPVYSGAETGLFKNFLDRLYAILPELPKTPGAEGKKGSILLTCGSPDGNMLYQSTVTRMMGIMRSFGISDVSSGIIPNGEDVENSDHFKDYMDALDFQTM